MGALVLCTGRCFLAEGRVVFGKDDSSGMVSFFEERFCQIAFAL
jgi:hypothetical protein